MSWEQRTKNHPWINKYYTKENNFKVQCREPSCKKAYKYVRCEKYSEFKTHLRDIHKDFYEYEEHNMRKDWKYFRLTKEKKTDCILCDTDAIEFSTDDDLSEHVKKHLDRQQIPIIQGKEDWGWKYLKQIGDFSAQCNLCENKTEIITLHLLTKHLKNHIQDAHNQIIDEIIQDKPSWKFYTENNYFLNKCFTKLVNCRITCLFCDQSIACITAPSLKQHLQNHEFIYETEETTNKELTNKDWQYFRFTKQQVEQEIECIICKETVQNERQIIRNHIASHYPVKPNITSRDWTFKYIRQEEDIIKCMICEENIKYYLNINHLKSHMERQHLAKFKEINKNEEFWNLQTETNSWFKKCYIDAGDFRAKCKFCECKEVYIKNKQFEEHVSEAHGLIHFFETCCKSFDLYQDQWKYLRYTDNKNKMEPETECIICQKIVSVPHLNHCPQELKSYSHHWALKYAKQNKNRAECTICGKDVKFVYDMDNLKDHMLSAHPQEWKNIQQRDLEQAYDQAGPSTSYAS